jgi:hypothetical protein
MAQVRWHTRLQDEGTLSFVGGHTSADRRKAPPRPLLHFEWGGVRIVMEA